MAGANFGTLEALIRLRDELSPALKIAAANVKQTGDQIKKVGQDILPLSAGLAAAGAGALKFSGDFQASMTRLVSLAGVSSGELEKVKAHILALAPASGIGPQELANAMTVVSSTVSDTNTALSILDIAAKGTTAGLGETADVARALTAVVNAYGSANITAAQAGDILTKTVQDGGAEAKELAPALGNVIPLAAQLGISFSEVGANIATLTKLGVPATEAVTSLRAIMVATLNPTNEQTEALKSVGLTLGEVRDKITKDGLAAAMTDLTKRFGDNKEGLAAVFGRVEALSNVMGTAGQQAKTYAEEVDRITKSTGTLDSATKAMAGTTVQSWKQLSALLGDVAIKVGDALAPSFAKLVVAMVPVVEWLAKLIDKFTALPQGVQTGVIAVLGFTAVLGPAMYAIGNVVSALGSFIGILAKVGPAVTAVTTWVGGLTTSLGITSAALATSTGYVLAFTAAFATGLAIGTMIRDINGFGAALDRAFSKSEAEIDALKKGIDVKKSWTAEQRAANDAWNKSSQVATINSQALGLNTTLLKALSTEVKTHTTLTKEQKEAIEQHNKAVQAMRDQLTGAGKDFKVFADAVSDQRVLASILGNESALRSAADQVKKFAEAGNTLTPAMQQIADKAQELDKHLDDEQKAMKDWADQLLQSAKDFESGWESIFGTVKNSEAIKQATDQFKNLENVLQSSGKTMEDMSQKELENLEKQLQALYSQLKDQNSPEAERLAVKLGLTREALREFGEGVEQGTEPCKKLAEEAKKLAEALQKAADASLVGKIGHAFDEANKAIQGIDQAMDALGVSSDNSFRIMADGLRQVDAGAEQFAKGGLGDMIAGLGQMAAGFMKSIDSASTFQRALGGLMAGAKIGKQIGMLAGPMGAAWGAVIGGLIGMTIGIFHKPAWAKVGDEAGKMLGTAIGKGISKTLEKQIADQAKKLGLSLHDAILLNLGKIAEETGAKMADMSDTILELMNKVADGTLPAKEGIEAIGDALSKLTDEALGGSADAMGDFTEMTAKMFQMIHDGSIPAQEGLDMLGEAFDKLKTAAEAGNKAASDMMFAMIMQARAAGVEIASISEYVKSELQKSREALEHMPPIVTEADAVAQASIFAASFWATVKEEGLVAAATAFKPAWEAIKKSLQDAGIDRSVVESIFGDISPVMRLVSDSVTGPIVAGIDALNQAFEGLSNTGYMTADAFAAFSQQAQSTYDRLIAAGVAPETALQAIAPLLQNLQDAAARYGFTLDENTQKLIDQATESGIAFSTDPQQQMVDLLSEIVQLMGGELPASVQTATTAIVDGADAGVQAWRVLGDQAIATTDQVVESNATGAATATQVWTDSMGTVHEIVKVATTDMVAGFSLLADEAGEDGEYVGEVWAQGIDEIALHAERQAEPVATAFELMADGAIGPLNIMGGAVDDIVKGLKAIPGAAQAAGDGLAGIQNGGGPGPGGGGNDGSGPSGGHGGHYQQFAEGGTVHAPSSGMPVEVHGTEHILKPEQLAAYIQAGVAAGIRAGGSAGGTSVNKISIDGRELLAFHTQASRRRQSSTHPTSVRRF